MINPLLTTLCFNASSSPTPPLGLAYESYDVTQIAPSVAGFVRLAPNGVQFEEGVGLFVP